MPNSSNIPLRYRQILFVVAIVVVALPIVSAPIALVAGLVFAQFVGTPWPKQTAKYTKKLLKASVVGLGFGLNASEAAEAGLQGFSFTAVSILGTLLVGTLLARALGVDQKLGHLINSGTAICGGSAIAAVAPAISSDDRCITVSLGVVFVLNSVALMLFPPIGQWLELTQQQFGLWAAIAIHDTSSVVGAAEAFGIEALKIATTVKLTRALWIIPLALGSAFVFRQKGASIKIPWFIGGFVLAVLINTYVPGVEQFCNQIVFVARRGLVVTLFLIGAGLSLSVIRSVGVRPMLQGVLLWVVVSVVSLWAIVGWV